MARIFRTSKAIVLPSCVFTCAVGSVGSVGGSGIAVVLWQLALVGRWSTTYTRDGNSNAKVDVAYGAPAGGNMGRLANTFGSGGEGEIWEMGGPLYLQSGQFGMPVGPEMDKVSMYTYTASFLSVEGNS